MIVVKIEMWPGGNENHPRKRELQRILITNIGSNAQTGDYDVTIPKSAEYARRGGVWKAGKVRSFPRLKLGPADLLLRALVACIAPRNREAVTLLGDPALAPSLSLPETIGALDASDH
jgi:hypothetical protein